MFMRFEKKSRRLNFFEKYLSNVVSEFILRLETFNSTIPIPFRSQILEREVSSLKNDVLGMYGHLDPGNNFE